MTDHLPKDHPPVTKPRIGVLFANLGTPDATDYWSMRRYLSEFLSDRRVVDYAPWKWQPLLQTIILTRRPFTSGAAYRSIWNNEADESPLLTITKQQVAKLRDTITQAHGPDQVLKSVTRFGLGLMLYEAESPIGWPGCVGHAGAGGSIGFYDPASDTAFAFVMNQMQEGVVTGGTTATACIAALHEALKS